MVPSAYGAAYFRADNDPAAASASLAGSHAQQVNLKVQVGTGETLDYELFQQFVFSATVSDNGRVAKNPEWGASPTYANTKPDLTLSNTNTITVNVVNVDATLDFGGDPQKVDGRNWLNALILPDGGHLFDLTNLGHQRYRTDGDALQLMERMHFDAVRLGRLRTDIAQTEPLLRDADLVTFDLGAVRAADHPATPSVQTNGLTGEELCQLARYAGYSDRLSAIGFFEHDPSLCRLAYHGGNGGGQLVAEAIWCFLEGVMHRIGDHPRGSTEDYLQYRVVLDDADHEVIFYKSPRSDRWWMDIPTPGVGNRKGRLLLVPCSYEDYQTATAGSLPDRWWRTQQKLA